MSALSSLGDFCQPSNAPSTVPIAPEKQHPGELEISGRSTDWVHSVGDLECPSNRTDPVCIATGHPLQVGLQVQRRAPELRGGSISKVGDESADLYLI